MLGLIPIFISVLTLGATPDIPDVTTLTPGQRTVYQGVISEEFCSCTSAMTIGGCLELRPKCGVARHLGDIAYTAAQSGNTTAEVLGFLSDRVIGPFCGKESTIAVAKAPSMGKSTAPITVVEFADFRCGHCKAAVPLVKRAAAQHPANARMVFVPFPLGDHPESLAAAEAALAAGAQGKFWEMHDALFANQALGFSFENLMDHAKDVGLNTKRFRKAMETHEYRAELKALKEAGLAAGVKGTPAFFVNGRRFDPAPALMTLSRRIDMELDRNRGQCQ